MTQSRLISSFTVEHNVFPSFLRIVLRMFFSFSLIRSHVFVTFFRIFFLVVLFGLFHGLAVLPVLLSLVGPRPNGGQLIAVNDKKVF